jgi:DNA repair protein RecO
MGNQKTLAILLGQTSLANDDVILEFFTSKWGRISVFAKKFSRSKKRAEIDFFRLIEIEIFQGRNSKSLRSATTETLFSEFEFSLETNTIGWNWIKRLRDTMPEERPEEAFFSEVLTWFGIFEKENAQSYDSAFRIRLLQHTGDCPRFDTVRDACWFDPFSKKFSIEKQTNWIYISNTARQICEFCRRSEPTLFEEKIKNIPFEEMFSVQLVISGIEEFLL